MKHISTSLTVRLAPRPKATVLWGMGIGNLCFVCIPASAQVPAPPVAAFQAEREQTSQPSVASAEKQKAVPAAQESSQKAQPETGAGPLSAVGGLTVKQFLFEGNTVFSQSQLSKITEPYLNRLITAEDLEEVRLRLTQHYVNHGYLNSGALFQEQDVAERTLKVTIVEGFLTQVNISGNRHYRTSYLEDILKRTATGAFNVTRTRDVLEVMRENSNVVSINALVEPGLRPGEATLQVLMEDRNPNQLTLEFDNHRPASIGAEHLHLVASNRNLTGRDDALEVRAGLIQFGNGISGGSDLAFAYESSPDAAHQIWRFSYARGNSGVIEEPFRTLDISSRFQSTSLGLSQRLHKSLTSEVGLSLSLEHRSNQTFLSGQPFSFSAGDVNGRAKTTALRFGADATRRRQKQVLAGRVLLSWGSNFPGSTRNVATPNFPNPPDGRFLTLLAQAQYVRLLNTKGTQWITRVNTQLSNRPLLSVEKFVIGGSNSVRGYRENQLVRDSGLVATTELRIPVYFSPSGQTILTVAPFMDWGYGRNKATAPAGTNNTLFSAGLGLLYTPNRRLNAQLYWGHPFRKTTTPGNDLQDKSLHFYASYSLL